MNPCYKCVSEPSSFYCEKGKREKKILVPASYVILTLLSIIMVLTIFYVYYQLHTPLQLFVPKRRFFLRKHLKKKPIVPFSLYLSRHLKWRTKGSEIEISMQEDEITTTTNQEPECTPIQDPPPRLPTPSYRELSFLVQKHLPDEHNHFQEKDFHNFFQEYFNMFTPSQVCLKNEEKRLENCIKQSIAEWSWWNQLRLKKAIDAYKPKIQQWLIEKEIMM